jgi:DNA-binding MarR family transcriptional regulator
MLLPMEKLGMLKRENSEDDGRVSYVKLASGGRRLLDETLEEAEILSEELLPSVKLENAKEISEIFKMFSLGKIG